MISLEEIKEKLIEIINQSPNVTERQLGLIPSNYEELRQIATIKEYLAEKHKLSTLLDRDYAEVVELKFAFMALCDQRDTENFSTALHFSAMPESVCNYLYWDFAVQLFEPKHLGEIIAILMPRVVAFLTMDFFRKSADNSKLMTHVQLKLQTGDLAALENYPPDLTMLTKCIIGDQLIFPIEQIAELPFHFQQKLYMQLDQYPVIKQQLYNHNAALQKLGFNIELIEHNGRTLRDTLSKFELELRRCGERFTGNHYAANASSTYIYYFMTYLESLPEALRTTIELLENDSKTTIKSVLEHLDKGDCVETAADVLVSIRDNPSNRAIMEQHANLSDDDYYKITHSYGRSRLEIEGFDPTTKLPDALRREVIQNIKISSTYDYIDLFLNLPSEEYQTILEHAVITCMPALPDNLASTMAMFTLEQSVAFVAAALQHRQRLGGIECVTKLAIDAFKRITTDTKSTVYEVVIDKLLCVIEEEIYLFRNYEVAMEFILTVCDKTACEKKLIMFPLLERIRLAVRYNFVDIIKTYISSSLVASLPRPCQENLLYEAISKNHIEIIEHLLSNGFILKKAAFLSRFIVTDAEPFAGAFRESTLLRHKFIVGCLRNYQKFRSFEKKAIFKFCKKYCSTAELDTFIAALPAFVQAGISIEYDRPDIIKKQALTNVFENFTQVKKRQLLQHALPGQKEIAEILVQNNCAFDVCLLREASVKEEYRAAIVSSTILSAAYLNAFIDQYTNSEVNSFRDILEALLSEDQLCAIPLRLPTEEKCRLAVKMSNLACLKQQLSLLNAEALRVIMPALLGAAITNGHVDIVSYLLHEGAQLNNTEIIAISNPANQTHWPMIQSQFLFIKLIRDSIIHCMRDIPVYLLNDDFFSFCDFLWQDDPTDYQKTILKSMPATNNLLVANQIGRADVVNELVTNYAKTTPDYLTITLERAVLATHPFLLEASLQAGVNVAVILKAEYFSYIFCRPNIASAFLKAISEQTHTFNETELDNAVLLYHQHSRPEVFEQLILSLPDEDQVYYAAIYGLSNVIKQFAHKPALLNGYLRNGYFPLQMAIDERQYDVAALLLHSGANCYCLMGHETFSAKIKGGFAIHKAFRNAFLNSAVNLGGQIPYYSNTIGHIKIATSVEEFKNFLSVLPAYHQLYYALIYQVVDVIQAFNDYAELEHPDDPSNYRLLRVAVHHQLYKVAAKLLQVNDDVHQFLTMDEERLSRYLTQISQDSVLAQLFAAAIVKHKAKIKITPVIVKFYHQCTDEVCFKQLILSLSAPEQFYYACCYNMLALVDCDITNADLTNKIDNGFASPLLEAMRHGYNEVVNRLLKQNLGINTKSRYLQISASGTQWINETPLEYALNANRLDYAKLLLQHGAIITQPLLKLAISQHHTEIAIMMLRQTNCLDDLKMNKKSLFAWAVITNQQTMIDILIQRFTIETIYDEDKVLTPVYWAVKQGNLAMLKQLLAFNVPIGKLGENLLKETDDPKIRVLLKLALFIADHNINMDYKGLGNLWQQTMTSSNFFNQAQRFTDNKLNTAVNLFSDLLASETTLKKPDKTIFADNASLHEIYREAKLAFKP